MLDEEYVTRQLHISFYLMGNIVYQRLFCVFVHIVKHKKIHPKYQLVQGCLSKLSYRNENKQHNKKTKSGTNPVLPTYKKV